MKIIILGFISFGFTLFWLVVSIIGIKELKKRLNEFMEDEDLRNIPLSIFICSIIMTIFAMIFLGIILGILN